VRDLNEEKSLGDFLRGLGLPVRSSKVALDKRKAFDWINMNRAALDERGVKILQNTDGQGKRYFLGNGSISVGIREHFDWSYVDALPVFGHYPIPRPTIRKLLLHGKAEFELPNGEVAMIPDSWFVNYSEIFSFLETEKSSGDKMILKKHHVALANA